MSRYFNAESIGEKTWLILECGFDAIYYLEGSERGLLIDTGIGAADLKAFVAQIATKPYDVVLTHGHLDHIGAIWQYDRIYVNDRDIPLIQSCTDEARIQFMLNMSEMSEGRTVNQHPADIRKRGSDPEFCSIGDESCFHLGGRDVTVFCTSGHTPGSVCLHDSLTGLLFVGDTLIYRLLLPNNDMTPQARAEEWRRGTRRIYDHSERYTDYYMGHCGRVPDYTYEELDALTEQYLSGQLQLETSESAPKLCTDKTRIYFGVPFREY